MAVTIISGSNNMHQMSSSSLSHLDSSSLRRFVPYCRKLCSSLRLAIQRPQILLNSQMILPIVRWSLKFSCSLIDKSTSALRQQLFSGLQFFSATSYTSLRLVSSSSSLLWRAVLLDGSACSCSWRGVSMVFSKKSQQLDSSASLLCTFELMLDSAKFFSSTFSMTLSSFFQRCSFSLMWSQGLTSFSSLDNSENRQWPFFSFCSFLLSFSCQQGTSRLIFVLVSSLRWSSFLKVPSAFDFYSLVLGSCLMGLEVLRESPFPSEDSTLCKSWQNRSRLKLALRLSALPWLICYLNSKGQPSVLKRYGDQLSLLMFGIGIDASTAYPLGIILHSTMVSWPLVQTILKVFAPLQGGSSSKLFSVYSYSLKVRPNLYLTEGPM